MKPESIQVSVIIPTAASRQRAGSLKRAIESIRNSSRTPVQVIVVANGPSCDPGVCAWLKAQPDVKFDHQQTGSAPLATLRGRQLVRTEYFSTLDDDDEYIEGATDDKLRVMQADPTLDLVVADGFRHLDGVDIPMYPLLSEAARQPLHTLMRFNWLHNCNALYRSATVGAAFFEDSHPYGEWTWLAFKLMMANRRVGTLCKPTFRYFDTANSLSKSEAYRNAYLSLFERMLALSPPAVIARQLRRKMSSAWHDASMAALHKGHRLKAWQCHCKSLLLPGGLRYLASSRHFLVPMRADAAVSIPASEAAIRSESTDALA
jgi:glycosyltransferase involved in cell wall biosynthesis